MKKPYLIQRMRFRNYPSGNTIDDILEIDYMGSAEFEFGALPKSLKKMTKTCDDITFEFIKSIKNYKNQGFCLIGLPDDIEGYKQFLNDLVEEKLWTKESVKFKQMIDGKSIQNNSWFRVDVWWDIDNQIMFCFGKDNARSVIKSVQAVRDKKKQDGNTEWV